MPLYVADYRKDTARLTCEQHGVYLLLLMDYWVGGPLPNDDVSLAQIAHLEMRQWRKHRPAIERFFQVKSGSWRHKRVDEERLKADRMAEARRQNGARGGRPSKANHNLEQTGGGTGEEPGGFFQVLKTPPKNNLDLKLNETPTRVARPSPSPLPPEGSEDKSSDAEGVVFDIGKECWRAAVQLLQERDGLSETGARKFFGALLAEHGLAARDMYPPVANVATNGTEGARAYLTKAAQRIAKERGQPKLSAHDRYVRSNII